MTYKIHNADCLKQLKKLPDNSIDSIVTDPPYEIGFMGKKWDNSGIAYKKEMWQECLRVLKPGGHLLAFGATRSYHRMAVAIEDAGFEIRDSIHWTYGSGFPKSLDVSKAIDKAAGAEREVVSSKRTNVGMQGNNFANGGKTGTVDITAPATDQAKQWAGWGTALKPSHEPIVVARKPLVGTVASNVLEYGTGGLNIDGTRVGFVSDADEKEAKNKNQHADFGTVIPSNPNVYGDYSMVEVKNYNPPGRFPANTVLTHAAECEATGETTEVKSDSHWSKTKTTGFGKFGNGKSEYSGVGHQPKTEGIPVYKCVPGCPIPELDKQSGTSKSTDNKWEGENNAPIYGKYNKGIRQSTYSDKGGASRFFTQTHWTQWDDLTPFLYIPKPSKKERNKGLEEVEAKSTGIKGHGLGRICATCGTKQMTGCECPDATYINPPASNFHPTVKPVELMRHLCRLVTPPNGVVLDPFTGSGTTGVAAILEGFNFIGIELTEEYISIIKARLKQAEKEYKETQPTLPLEETE